MSYGLFTNLSAYAVADVLVSWLRPQEIARLDASICCHNFRAKLFAVYELRLTIDTRELFKHNRSVGSEVLSLVRDPVRPRGVVYADLLNWCIDREVYNTSILVMNLDPDMVPLFQQFIQMSALTITSAEFDNFGYDTMYWNDDTFAMMMCEYLCEHCPNVTELTVSSKLDDEQYVLIAQSWPQLHALRGPTSAYGFHRIATECEFLQSVEGPGNLDRVLRDHVVKEAFEKLLILHGTSLHSVHLTPESSAELLQVIAEHCPNLRSLTLQSIRPDPPSGLEHLITGCPLLQDIAIEGCFPSGGSVAVEVLKQLGSRVLVLRLIGATGLEPFLTCCPNLRTLQIDASVDHRGTGLIAESCPQLTELRLREVTDAGLRTISERCQTLTVVDFTSGNMSNTAMLAFLQHYRFLTSLRLHNCEKIADGTVQRLPELCPHLLYFGCDRTAVTMEGVKTVVQGCRKLTRIDLPTEGCYAEAVEARAEGSLFPPKLMVRCCEPQTW